MLTTIMKFLCDAILKLDSMPPAPYPTGGTQQWPTRPGVPPSGQSSYPTGPAGQFRPPSTQAPPTGSTSYASPTSPTTSQPPYSFAQSPQQLPYGPVQGYPYSQAPPAGPTSSLPTSQPSYASYTSGPY